MTAVFFGHLFTHRWIFISDILVTKRENFHQSNNQQKFPGQGRHFTCEMEPPRIKDGFSEATVVLDDGMRGGGGLVGRVVGRRTASGRFVIT